MHAGLESGMAAESKPAETRHDLAPAVEHADSADFSLLVPPLALLCAPVRPKGPIDVMTRRGLRWFNRSKLSPAGGAIL